MIIIMEVGNNNDNNCSLSLLKRNKSQRPAKWTYFEALKRLVKLVKIWDSRKKKQTNRFLHFDNLMKMQV